MSSTPALIGLLPVLLRRQLATAGGRTCGFSARRLPAAVFIADVAGFTSLADRLASRGPDGVEELSRLVNRWFGAMVDVIEEHGGDVVRFAGDAPIAVFPADGPGSELRDAVAGAASSAAALRNVMRDLRTAEADITVRTGIGAGEVTAVIAGGTDGRWEFVVGGSPFDQMAEAERRAAPGEIVLSAEASAVLGSTDGALLPGGACRLGIPPSLATSRRILAAPQIDDAAARSFVPRAVLHFLDAGQSAWTAELRQVTALFLGVGGIDIDAPDGADRVHDALGRLQTAVFDQGGSINQFLVDDKGLTLLASWGGSGHRHEDDAARAVHAALACRAALADLGATARGGLATGRVFCGWRGNERRREYALIGAVVNRAARLMTATADELRCDDVTARAGRSAGRFEEAGLLTLKGTAEPVATYRPTGDLHAMVPGLAPPAGTPAVTTEMIGREAERNELAAALTSLRSGSSATIVIRGDAGIGKSTLVASFLAMARAAGVAVAAGSVESASGSGPYVPWRNALGSVLGLDGVNGTAARIGALTAAFAGRPGLEEFTPLVAEVLGLPMPDQELTSRIVQQARVEKTRDLVVQVLQEAAAVAPLVVVLDNVHWMDSLSLNLALAAERRVAPLLLVLVSRPFDPPPEVANLFEAPSTRILDMSRLGADDVRRLICRRLGVTHVPDALTAIVEEKAAGYPLFAGELVSSLLDAGVIQTSGSACVLTDSGARLRLHQFPDSVQGAIAHRLDRMGAAEQLTMKVASAVGAPFDAETIAAVHPLQPGRAELDGMFAALVHRGFIVRGDRATFEFGHAVMQDVAYGMMLSDQRRALHRAIGERYEDTRDVPAAVLAHHWKMADDEGRSLHWLERAGEEASRLGALRETLRHFGDALEIADRPGAVSVEPLRRIRWLRFIGHAHAELGSLDESTERLRTALSLLGERLPGSTLAMGVRLGREAIRQTALLSGVLRSPARLSVVVRARMLEKAEVLRLLGKIGYYAQDHLRYITASLQSINLAERVGARETAASAYAALGYPVAMLGLERLAERWWRLADQSGELDAQLNLLSGRMLFLNSHARWAESARSAEEQAALIARLGTSTTFPAHLLITGYIHLHHGRYDAAIGPLSSLLDWALSVNHLQQAFAAHLQLAVVLLEQGKLHEARRHLTDAGALSTRVADPVFLSIFRGVAVDACLHAGDLEAAREPAAALRTVIASSSPYFGDMVGFVAMTEYFVARWRQPAPGENAGALKRDARWAHGTLKKHARMNPYARPRAWLLDGKIAACDRQFARAHRSWRRARALAERYEMAREIAHASAELGGHSALPAVERRAHLVEARTLFERMGSPHRVTEMEEALARL